MTRPIQLEIGRTLELLVAMSAQELSDFYCRVHDERVALTDREERERLRLLLLVIDAIGEYQWPSKWRGIKE